ncbi:MAG: sugar ABC transporter permease, partial [Clostridia bacterium]|nr:sugar ABC transporter permease [Clostridia bacterium]
MNENHSVSLVNDVTGEALFPVAPKKRKKPINKEAIAGTIFASGPLLGFIIFGVIPLCLAFAMAFLKMKGFSFKGAKLVDPLFANFKTVVEDDKFWEAIINTLILGTSTLISLVLSLIIAYLLSKEIRGKKVFRIIYFIPYVCSAVAVV